MACPYGFKAFHAIEFRLITVVRSIPIKNKSTCSTAVRILHKDLGPVSFEPFQACGLVASWRGRGCTRTEVTVTHIAKI